MFKATRFIVLFFLVICPFIIHAQSNELVVGDVELSGMRWGDQTVNIDLTNNSEYVKYIVAEVKIDFTGTYLNPSITRKSTYIVGPDEAVRIDPEFFIPGNYGNANIDLKLYDVVDTLDALLPRQVFYTQPFKLTFHIPDEIYPYLQERVTLPPRVDVHPNFTNEFSRILFLLLKEGKTLEEIAALNKCDLSFVQQQVDLFVKNKYLRKNDTGVELAFPFISMEEAEAGRAIAEKVADSLTVLIKNNMDGYWQVIDSLVQVKAIPNDSNDFISGASLLFKPTPIVTTFVLWYELGRNFITRSAPLLIYDGTDICNAGNVQYMYAVNGGPYLNGTNFFGLFLGRETYSLMFSYEALNVTCYEDFHIKKSLTSKGVWNYNHPDYPEYFIVDSTKVRPLITQLAKNSSPLIDSAYQQLKDNAYAHGQGNVFIGHRYWFWNLVATQTINKLHADGILNKREYTFFRFDKIKDH